MLAHPGHVAGQLRAMGYCSSRHQSTFEAGITGKGSALTIFRKARTVSKTSVGSCFYLSDMFLSIHVATEQDWKVKFVFPIFRPEVRKGEGGSTR